MFECALLNFFLILASEIKKWKLRSQSTIFVMTPFDGKCQNLQMSFFTFLILAKVRSVRKKVTETHTQTDTEMDKPIAVDDIMQICLNIVHNI